MPSWGNTDSLADKPHFPFERQVRPFATLTTYSTTASGNTIIFTGSGPTTAANIGITAGMYAYATNLSTTGEAEFFVSNNAVKSVTGNVVVFTANVMSSIPAGTIVDFATPIAYNQDTANTYFSDTVLVSNTRIANATFGGATNHTSAHTGWVRVLTGTGGRAGRVTVETLVALSNVVTSNTLSGNTSNSSTFYRGL